MELPVLKLFWALVSRVFASLASPPVVAWLRTLHLPVTFRRWLALSAYRSSLPEKLRRMPFIYAGIEADVLNDFVDIELNRLDASTFDSKDTERAAFRFNPWEVLQNRRAIAIIGNAGIGKTTFQRHSILQVLSRTSNFLHKNENPLPLYVALKVVPNSGPFPIMRFLRDAEPFLGDVSYLTAVTARRGLFLCLDGYDEIALTGTTENYIQQELELILCRRPPGKRHELRASIGATQADQYEFYRALALHSRVWLTSRPQFIQHHPIGAIGNRNINNFDEVATIGIVGIGQNRESLVRRVFERYSSTHVDVRSLLDAEYFLQYIDKAQDGEIRDMSFNPLFLTVMCYNYAQTVLKEQRHDVELSGTFDALIIQCIDLLLLDLDEYKARQFTAVQKHAIENRRNQFVQEKKLFLRFLAGYSYLHDTNVFTERRLTEVLYSFLDEQTVSSGKDIKHTFEYPSSDRPSFIRQLIYCGLFVLVDTSNGVMYYDFPHRRFREVLAAAYFADPQCYAQFIVQLAARGQSALIELTNVLTRSNVTTDSSIQRGALQKILDDMLSEAPHDFVRVTDEFVSMLPEECSVSDVLRIFLSRVTDIRVPRFEASAKLLQLCDFEIADIHKFEKYIEQRYRESDPFGVGYGCSVLGMISPHDLGTLTERILLEPDVPPEIISILLRSIVTVDSEWGWRLITETLLRPDTNWGAVDAACDSIFKADDATLRKFLQPLDERRTLEILLYMAQMVQENVVAEEQWIRLTEIAESPYELAGVMACRDSDGSTPLLVLKGEETLFYLSDASIEGISRELQERQKLLDVGKIGEAGPQARALALKEYIKDVKEANDGSRDSAVTIAGNEVSLRIQDVRSAKYAVVRESDVLKVCEGLVGDLQPLKNSFITSLGPVRHSIARALTKLFDLAEFTYNRTNVAFTADDSYVFTKQALEKMLIGRATQLASWPSTAFSEIVSAWPGIPCTMQRVPRYFI